MCTSKMVLHIVYECIFSYWINKNYRISYYFDGKNYFVHDIKLIFLVHYRLAFINM